MLCLAFMQTDGAPNSPLPVNDLVRVQLPEDDLSFDAIKAAIYSQARYLHEKGQPISHLLLSKDLHEILNRRLVFKTPAHKDQPHFITPYGNLTVEIMGDELDAPLSFIIEA
jgi:hypothetical protein